MKKLLLIAAMLFSTSTFAACPATLSGNYSGFIRADLSQFKTIVAQFGPKNTINVLSAYGNTYDSSGNALVQWLNYPQFSYSYNKSICSLRAWPVGTNSSQYDLFLNVSASGTNIEGFQVDQFDTYEIHFTKQ